MIENRYHHEEQVCEQDFFENSFSSIKSFITIRVLFFSFSLNKYVNRKVVDLFIDPIIINSTV